MKKLHSLAFYALVTPIATLGAGSALAQQPAVQDTQRQQQQQQPKQQPQQQQRQPNAASSTPGAQQGKQSPMQTEAQAASQGFMDVGPTNGMHGSELIGAEVKTTNDEDVGEVQDLIVNERGQVVAIVIGVGGVLGMGEKNVAIAWDKLMRSGQSDDLELRIDGTREDLRAAPNFEWRD